MGHPKQNNRNNRVDHGLLDYSMYLGTVTWCSGSFFITHYCRILKNINDSQHNVWWRKPEGTMTTLICPKALNNLSNTIKNAMDTTNEVHIVHITRIGPAWDSTKKIGSVYFFNIFCLRSS